MSIKKIIMLTKSLEIEESVHFQPKSINADNEILRNATRFELVKIKVGCWLASGKNEFIFLLENNLLRQTTQR